MIMTSSSGSISHQMLALVNNISSCIKICSIMDCFYCGEMLLSQKPVATMTKVESVIWVWISPLFQIIVNVALALSEQSRLLSACGIAFQFAFQWLVTCL